jgi:gluconate 2-dehydrogenase gamma chain
MVPGVIGAPATRLDPTLRVCRGPKGSAGGTALQRLAERPSGNDLPDVGEVPVPVTERLLDDELSRRQFIRRIAVTAVATTATGAVLDACAPASETPPPYFGAPSEGPIPSPSSTQPVLDAQEAATLDAVTERMLPSSALVPGARTAGVVDYVQRRLALGQGIPTYVEPPFVRTYHGETPPGPDTDQVIWVPASELYRYGIQNVELPADEQYHRGLAALDAWTRKRHGKAFADLDAKQQDAVVGELSGGEPDTFSEELTSKAFFQLLYNDAMQGWLADPTYGGNRDLAVWNYIRYPGAQRMYTPSELTTGSTDRQPQSLSQLPPMHPGEPEPHVVLPIKGQGGAGTEGAAGEGTHGFVCDVPVQR